MQVERKCPKDTGQVRDTGQEGVAGSGMTDRVSMWQDAPSKTA